jgi:hypothetical protein
MGRDKVFQSTDHAPHVALERERNRYLVDTRHIRHRDNGPLEVKQQFIFAFPNEGSGSGGNFNRVIPAEMHSSMRR